MTLEEKTKLYRLLKMGCDSFEIADRMGLSHRTVSRAIRALGLDQLEQLHPKAEKPQVVEKPLVLRLSGMDAFSAALEGKRF